MELYSKEIIRNDLLVATGYLNPTKPPKSEYQIKADSFTCKLEPKPVNLKYKKPKKNNPDETDTVYFEISDFAEPWLVKSFDENFVLRRSHVNSIFLSFEASYKFDVKDLELELSQDGEVIFKTDTISNNIELKYFKCIKAFNIKLIVNEFGLPNYIKNGKMVHVLSNSMFNNLQLSFKIDELMPLKNFEFKCVNENLIPISINNCVLKFELV